MPPLFDEVLLAIENNCYKTTNNVSIKWQKAKNKNMIRKVHGNKRQGFPSKIYRVGEIVIRILKMFSRKLLTDQNMCVC